MVRGLSGLVFVLFFVASVWGDDTKVGYAQASGSWSSRSGKWTRSARYSKIRGYARRPDDKVLSAVQVEWKKIELDKLGNMGIVRGRLSIVEDKGKPALPVNWFQGLTVYMGKAPSAKPKWSQGMNEDDTVARTVVTRPSGEFHVVFDLRETRRDRQRRQAFQVGVALARHMGRDSGQRVVWESRTPAITSSTRMLELPKAPTLGRELQLINEASRWPFRDPNTVRLIQAVNALQPLGKQKALAILERYDQLTSELPYEDDAEIIFWIIRSLFEPIGLSDRIPSPAIAVYLNAGKSESNWPLRPMAVVEGVPFMVGGQIGMGGLPEQPSSHIRWARRHGVIRDAPIKPRANPLKAAQALLSSTRFQRLDKWSRSEALRSVRAQALAMVAPSLPGIRSPYNDEKKRSQEWSGLVGRAAALGIRWDVQRQRFREKEK